MSKQDVTALTKVLCSTIIIQERKVSFVSGLSSKVVYDTHCLSVLIRLTPYNHNSMQSQLLWVPFSVSSMKQTKNYMKSIVCTRAHALWVIPNHRIKRSFLSVC